MSKNRIELGGYSYITKANQPTNKLGQVCGPLAGFCSVKGGVSVISVISVEKHRGGLSA